MAPCAPTVLGRLVGDERFKPELPAAQLEIAAAEGLARPAGAGVHPFAGGIEVITSGERYERIHAEFGGVVRRQLVFGLHVHVALGDPDRVLAVYNALREHLPALAALAGASPFYGGFDEVDEVDERWAWDFALPVLRGRLEDVFETGLAEALAGWQPPHSGSTPSTPRGSSTSTSPPTPSMRTSPPSTWPAVSCASSPR
ncbi:MAG TPA: glutamate-cysteine ligase family protein [Baekduia sp.]|uniref:glutamate-cysteine ligase family protein n=1 Tax=Baekduia sp. TaxID=2600305 RepID=UPI002C990FFA|nr:glutamate-cysteine ligase family protein [Baekduia sp.]HMJ35464.1 glutamate-cysteine ligase family protein [Baekduia sp.]